MNASIALLHINWVAVGLAGWKSNEVGSICVFRVLPRCGRFYRAFHGFLNNSIHPKRKLWAPFFPSPLLAVLVPNERLVFEWILTELD